MLIEFGADVNATNRSGQCALGLAAHHAQAELVQLLVLRCSADVRGKAPHQMSVLTAACAAGDERSVLHLLHAADRKADKAAANLASLLSNQMVGRNVESGANCVIIQTRSATES